MKKLAILMIVGTIVVLSSCSTQKSHCQAYGIKWGGQKTFSASSVRRCPNW